MNPKKKPCTCGGAAVLEAGREGEPVALADYPFDQCLRDQKKRGYSEESARKICGYIKAKNAEGTHVTAEDAATALGLTARQRTLARVNLIGECRTIGCVATMLDASEPGRPKWIQVAAVGGYNGYSAGAFTLSTADLQQMVDNFHAHPSYREGAETATNAELTRGAYDVIPFDWRHASEKAPTTPEAQAAYAWALDMEVRDGANGAELWSLVRYLDRIVPLIKSGAIKSTSIAAWPNAEDPVSGENIGWYISSIAFTNDPFIQGMVRIPVAADAGGGATRLLDYDDGPASGPYEALCAVKEIFGLSELATLNDVMHSVVTLRAMAGSPPPGVDLEGIISKLRVAFNMPALSSAGDVLAETDKLLGALAAMVPPSPPQGTPTASYAEGVPHMNELKRLAARLGVGAEVITAARGPSDLEGPIFAALATLEDFRRQACDALGASTPGDAAARIAKLTRDSQLLTEMMPKYEHIKQLEAKAEAERVETDVQAALSQHRLPTTAAPALRWLRKDNPAEFARQYPLMAAQVAYLGQDIATSGMGNVGHPMMHQQVAPQVVSPVLRALEAGQNGVAFARPVVPEDGPGHGAVTINLESFDGRNTHERAMNYVRAQPGGEKLCFDDVHERASILLANIRRGGRAA